MVRGEALDVRNLIVTVVMTGADSQPYLPAPWHRQARGAGDRPGAKGGEQRAEDASILQRPERGDVEGQRRHQEGGGGTGSWCYLAVSHFPRVLDSAENLPSESVRPPGVYG
jgi:hypothetical protein